MLLDECTRDGSLDWHGKPAVKRKTGGWKSGMLLLVNEGLATLAFTGVEVNMVLFSKSVLRQSNAEAANMFSTWMGSVYLFSLLGAFISDSYLGRYLTCVVFQVILTMVSQPFSGPDFSLPFSRSDNFDPFTYKQTLLKREHKKSSLMHTTF
ncbi:putative proton-dependent oligopeptide transporter family, MFS transporter superfamily [Helianthus debilis subsp. tardiflorus]